MDSTHSPTRARSLILRITAVAILVGGAAVGALIGSSTQSAAQSPKALEAIPSLTSETTERRTGPPVASSVSLVVPPLRRPLDLEDGRTIGRSDAPADLTIWGDFQCPYCGEFARRTEPRLLSDYVTQGQLRITYRDWVFIGAESVSAAVAARCAGEQGQFWRYHDYLLWNQVGENSGGFSDQRLDAIANAIGLDVRAFTSCTLDDAQIDAVRAETEAGDSAGIAMTPTLVVGEIVMPGAHISEADYKALRAVIDASIAGHAAGKPGVSPANS